MKPIGDVLLNLKFVLIVPLVLLSVSSSIYNMRESNMVGNIIFVFMLTAVIGAIVAYVFTLIYNPLDGIDKSDLMASLPDQSIKQLSSAEVFVNLFTVSDFHLLFTKSSLLPLIIFSTFLGLATSYSKEKGKVVADFLNSGASVIMKMMGIIMKAAPLGLGCYFADTVGRLGGQILNGYMHVFILYLILTTIAFFGLNSIYVLLAGGEKGFLAFWKNILTPALTAIATSSSAACIPVNIEASKKMGIPDSIAETVIPLGTNIHKDGSVMAGVLQNSSML